MLEDNDQATNNSRFAALEARLAAIQKEYADALRDIHDLIRVSVAATESAKKSAEKASLAANFAL